MSHDLTAADLTVPRPDEYVRLLAAAIDAKGGYFPGHSDGVAYVCRLMASEAHLPDEFTAKLQLAALLHDVGKAMVPTSILNKAGKLDAAEWRIMREHPGWGALIAERIEGVTYAAHWVLCHHEHWNGGGYPFALKGEEIPLGARMLHVADAFHVMTSNRPYAPSMGRREALREIASLADVQFCPRSVQMLLGTERDEGELAADWSPLGAMQVDTAERAAEIRERDEASGEERRGDAGEGSGEAGQS